MQYHYLNMSIRVKTFTKKLLIFRLLVVLCGLICINNECSAIRVLGYILNENSDTIYGTVKISRFNQVTGGFILNGIDLESYHLRVIFKSNESKRFHIYFPEKILGFGFRYKSTYYVFQRFKIDYNSVLEKESQRYRFL